MGLTLLITGASGFIGQGLAATALRRGHEVRALTRSTTAPLPEEATRVTGDLAAPGAELAEALAGTDAVIHAAGAMSGDPAAWQRDTIAATTALLEAMQASAPSARLVLLSSIAVYDADAAEVTEETPLDPNPEERDGYARSKLAQEALLGARSIEAWIARPGAVFGPDRLWNAHIGPRVGPLLIRLGHTGQIPLVSRDDCCAALISAAETPVPGGGQRAVNLVASDLPDRPRFLAALGPAAPRLSVPLPWRLAEAAGATLGLLPGLRSRRPGWLVPRTLRARVAPKRYSNARARAELGWSADQPFENAVNSAREAGA